MFIVERPFQASSLLSDNAHRVSVNRRTRLVRFLPQTEPIFSDGRFGGPSPVPKKIYGFPNANTAIPLNPAQTQVSTPMGADARQQ